MPYITPYKGARAISTFASYGGRKISPYAKAASMAYRNGPKVARAARVIGRMGRRYISRKRKKKMFGPQPSVRVSGKSNAVVLSGTVGYRDLNVELIYFKRSGINIGERTKTFPHCAGIRLAELLTFEGINDNSLNKDIVVHFMVCQMKAPRTAGNDWTPISIKAAVQDEFFRSPISNSDRTSPFTDYVNGEPWAYFYNVANVAPEQFSILMHKKKVMSPRSSSQLANGCRHRWSIQKWLKVNRKIEFESPGSTTPERPFFTMMWYQTVAEEDHPLGTAIPFINRETRNITYIKDVPWA